MIKQQQQKINKKKRENYLVFFSCLLDKNRNFVEKNSKKKHL